MRKSALALVLTVAAAPTMVAAQAAAPAPTAEAGKLPYSSTTTTLGTLMADPQAKAVLVKHVPMFNQNADQGAGQGGIQEQASGMTLKELADVTKNYTGEMLSDKVLAGIDADLAKLTPAK